MPGNSSIYASVAGRYAKALFELALEDGGPDQAGQDLEHFAALLEKNQDIANLVDSPVYSRKIQARALEPILDKTGIKGLTANFLGLVAQNGRLNLIREMIGIYQNLLSDHRGEILAEVISARPLEPGQLKALEKELKSLTGRKPRIDAKVDESLLGGLIVKLGSKMYDSSLATKLFNLQRAMKGAG